MKSFSVVVAGLLFCSLAIGQTNSSISSGAVSSNDLIYSVGNIYVNSLNADENNSGIIGSVSRIEFLVLNLGENIDSNTLKVYPNPTTDIVTIESNQIINEVYIYSLDGKLVTSRKAINNAVELADLKTGIYLLKLNNSNHNTLKIIKN